MLLLPDEQPIIILVVDDEDDDDLAAIVAREDMFPSERFGGVWGSGERDGNWLVAFQLIELGAGDTGFSRQYVTDNVHRELLEAVLNVPHIVAIMPGEIAADANTAADVAPRLGGALLVEVEQRSPQVARILAERDD